MKWIALLLVVLSAMSSAAALDTLEIPTELERLLSDTIEPYSIEEFLRDPSAEKVLSTLWQYLWKEVRLHARLMGQIILVAAIAAVLKEIGTSLSKAAAEAGFLATYLMLVLLVVASLKEAANLTTSTIVLLASAVQVAVPLVGLFLAAGGELVTNATLCPLILGLTAVVSVVVQRVVMPFALASGAVGLASSVAEKPRLLRLSGFFRWLGTLTLGFVNAVFFGLITSLGLGSAAQDSLALRTAKWLMGTVPVVGGQIAGTTDLLQASTRAIQSAASTVGLLFVFFATLFPVLRLAALVLAYKLTTAVVEAVAETRFVSALETMEKTLTFFLGLIVLTAVMFYIGLGTLAALGALILR